MEPERNNGERDDEYVDWRGRRTTSLGMGGVKAAVFICVVEVLENLVFLSNATNFVSYFKSSMHYPLAEAANMVTNFMGASFLLTIFGGFISDSFISRFWAFLLFGTLELLCRFLNKALMDETISPGQIEETRTFLGLLPIFLSTIMMNCCLAQLQTFSVQQGVLMNKRLFHNFEIPTPSLVVPPLIILLSSIPLYEHLAGTISKSKKFSGKRNPFGPLGRIGLGLMLASIAMAVAAIVETKRREAAVYDKVELRVYWLGFQLLLLALSDFFTLGGMLEFFYSEAPDSMRSMCTALAWCSTSMGYFLSFVLVWITNSVTGSLGKAWLGGISLNENRLELFYTLLCILNFLNLLNYVYWAKRF